MLEPHPPKGLSEAAQSLLRRLCEVAAEPGRRVFAVMDGAKFDNLPVLLRLADVSHRPLYRFAGGDYGVIVGGPWFVDPYLPAVAQQGDDVAASASDHPASAAGDMSDNELAAYSQTLSDRMMAALTAGDASGGGVLPPVGTTNSAVVAERLEKLVALSDGKAAAVFWTGDEGLTSENLFRHLRGINRIAVARIGQGLSQSGADDNTFEMAAASDDLPSEPETGAYDMAIFRHADANVIMQTFPALDGEQAMRLFGPADQLLFAPDAIWGGGVKRARRTDLEASPPRGRFRLDADMARSIGERRLDVSRIKVIAYLRDVDPEVGALSDDELHKRILRYETVGKTLGLRSERAHAEWAFLMSTTGDSIAREPEICSALRTAADPDKKLSDILNAMAHMAQYEAEGGTLDPRES